MGAYAFRLVEQKQPVAWLESFVRLLTALMKQLAIIAERTEWAPGG